MKRIAVVFALVSLLTVVFTGCKKDQNLIEGNITYKDAWSGEVKPADNATVYLMVNDNEYYAKTVADANGYYMFDEVPDGEYFLEAEKETTFITYKGESELFKVKGADILEMDLTLGSNTNAIYGYATINDNGNQYTSSDTWVYLYQHGSNVPIDSVQCDNDGYYQFLGLEQGTYDVDADYVDENNTYFYDLVENISVQSGDFVKADLTLVPDKK